MHHLSDCRQVQNPSPHLELVKVDFIRLHAVVELGQNHRMFIQVPWGSDPNPITISLGLELCNEHVHPHQAELHSSRISPSRPKSIANGLDMVLIAT